MRKLAMIIGTALLLTALCACSSGGVGSEPPSYKAGTLTISLDYEKQSGYASNQFAVWIEDVGGNLVKTLYATRYTANGGYKNRPDSIPLWVDKSNLVVMSKTDVDAVSGATPVTGTQYYTWDMTDKNNNAVAPGEYTFFVEGSLRWKNRVIYSGVVDTNGGSAVIEAKAEYFYEASGNNPALSEDASENAMISNVTADWRQ